MPGISIDTLIVVHVAISLVAIAAGVVVALGMASGRRLPAWTALFLATTVLTSLTGFLFPFAGFTPAFTFGVVSSVLLAAALAALYAYRLAGAWRPVYIVTALVALYLNLVVLVVQSFQKLETLRALAPTQTEAPFLAAQGAVLAFIVIAAVLALRRFHPASGMGSHVATA